MNKENQGDTMFKGEHMNRLVDRWFEILVIGIFSFGAYTLRDMSSSISQLNKSMAVIVEKVSLQEKVSDDHEQRLRIIESR